MAKTLVREYIFTPGASGVGTIKFPGNVKLEQLLIISNVTRNLLLYNFADPSYSGTTVAFTSGNTTDFPAINQREEGYTTITLIFNTSAQLAGDKLQIFYEDSENGIRIRPWAFGTDAIERMRVSNPQSLIDADFEYGLQPTKWAGYGTMRGYPSVYEVPGIDLVVVDITTDFNITSGSNSLMTVTTTQVHGMVANQAINITSLLTAIFGFSRATGNFIIYDVPTTTTLRYFANGLVGTSNGQSLLTDSVILKRGNLYTGASLNVTAAAGNGSYPTTITVTFGSNHGLVPGCPIYVTMTGGTNPSLANGQFFVESVPSLTTITFTARTSTTLVVTPGTATVFALSNSAIIHRPFDGGVLISCKTPTFGASTVRVSKKYFRYQSGKGMLWSTGTMLKPSYDIQILTANSTSVGATVTCKVDDVDHGFQIGAVVTISGVSTAGYNGTYTINAIIDDYTFTFLATNTLGTSPAVMDLKCQVSLTSWHGAVVRAGTFDEQNGIFWEWNGSTLAVVRRNATQQLTGNVTISPNSNTVNGFNTRFRQQIRCGDKMVIRGMTHYITQVPNDTLAYVTPDYRGVTTATSVKASIVVETRTPQNKFNIDKIDGTGKSGFSIDTSKMHMLGIQYTWYGAGFIDFMIRGSDGNWVFAHRIKNNNINNEAHMRTGNLPVRYSIDNDGSPQTTFLTADPLTNGTTLAVNDTTYFPTAGTLYIDNELIRYTGKTSTTLTGCIRSSSLSLWAGGAQRTFTAGAAAAHDIGTGIILVSNTASPTLSHWGSALIMDGNFDSDRGYIFNYQRNLSISATPVTAFAIRLAPSVSNAAVGDLGSKDLLNRSQLLLQSCAVQTYGSAPSGSFGSIIIEGVLNPKNYNSASWSPLNFESAGGQPSLSQIASSISWTSGSYAIPGEQVFAFSTTPNADGRLELDQLKELTNSPFGGVGAYPNGPDILCVNIRTAVGAQQATLLLRWGEAQA